jgi:peptidoglycan/LPS O-acetylase OafA/YrhL
MICAAVYNRDLRILLQTRVLLFFGRISYSLYLLHATVLYISLHLFYGALSKPLLFLLYLAASTITAALSYSFIEVPAIELGRRLTSSRRREPRVATSEPLSHDSSANASTA